MPTSVTGDSARKVAKSERLMVVLLLAISAWIQLTVVNHTTVDSPLRADAGDYFSYAYNLAHSGVYSRERTWNSETPEAASAPDSIRTPGYPLFLRLVGKPEPTQSHLHRVALWQGSLGVAVVWLTWCIARRFLPPWAALLATSRFLALYGATAALHRLVLRAWTVLRGLDYRVGFLLATALQVALSYLGIRSPVCKQ